VQASSASVKDWKSVPTSSDSYETDITTWRDLNVEENTPCSHMLR